MNKTFNIADMSFTGLYGYFYYFINFIPAFRAEGG